LVKDTVEILIKDRKTKPRIEDIVYAYNKLYERKELRRKSDLNNLAQKNKQTSSIVFAIVAKLANGEIEIVQNNREKLIKLKI